MRFNKYSFSAFTLAEVLITLGIIGIVAAMTIPTLISNYQKKSVESQVKQMYSTLQQVVKLAEADDIQMGYIGDANYYVWMRNWYDDYPAKHMKTDKYCSGIVAGCWHSQGVVKDLLGNAPGDEESTGVIGDIPFSFVDNKGRYYNMDTSAQSTILTYFGVVVPTLTFEMFIDVNGSSAPNIIGKDIYILVWTDKGLVPAGFNKTPAQVEENCISGNGYFCLSYLMQNNWTIDDRVWNR